MTGMTVATGEPFEYALIRVVPRVDRGEAINAGVILYSRRPAFLGCRIHLDETRLRVLDPAADLAVVSAALEAVDRDCRGPREADETPGERFRWLAATRSTVVQPGPVHSGLTTDPAAELDRLFATLVR